VSDPSLSPWAPGAGRGPASSWDEYRGRAAHLPEAWRTCSCPHLASLRRGQTPRILDPAQRFHALPGLRALHKPFPRTGSPAVPGWAYACSSTATPLATVDAGSAGDMGGGLSAILGLPPTASTGSWPVAPALDLGVAGNAAMARGPGLVAPNPSNRMGAVLHQGGVEEPPATTGATCSSASWPSWQVLLVRRILIPHRCWALSTATNTRGALHLGTRAILRR